MKNSQKNAFIESHTTTKMMRVMVIVSFFMLFFSGIVSAWEWDNVKSYDEETKTVTITNAFGLGEDISTIKLDTPQNVYVIRGKDRKVAGFTIDNYDAYDNVFNDMEFYNIRKSMKKFDREFTYKYKKSLGFETINEQEQICEQTYNEIEQEYVTTCRNVPTGKTHQKEIFGWVELDILKELPKGEITIGIFTDVHTGDRVEWIPTLFGVEIEEWAVWTESLNVELDSYYTLDESSGDTLDSVGTNDGAVYSATQGAEGILGTGYSFDGNDNVILGGVLNYTSNFTVAFWMYANTTAAQRVVSNWKNWEFATDSGNIRLTVWNATDKTHLVSTPLLNLSWQNVAGGFNGTYIWIATNGTIRTALLMLGNPVITLPRDLAFGSRGDNNSYFTGGIDEIAFWGRDINSTELTQLYNSGTGMTYDSFDDSPNVTLNSPANDADFINPTIDFNCTANDDKQITNVSLLVNGTIEQTNSSGFNNTLISFSETITGGTGFYNWTCHAYDNASQLTTATARNFTYSNPLTISLNSPVNTFNSTSQTIRFNGTAHDDTTVANVSFILNASYNGTNSSVFNATLTNFDRTLADGFYNWTIEACDNVGSCLNATARNFTIDSVVPIVNITYPFPNGTTITFHNSSVNQTINWTATDDNLGTCWIDYDFINRTVTCNVNTSSFTLTAQRNATFWANDTLGHENFLMVFWDYLILQNLFTFNSTSFETKAESFYVNITTNGSNPTNGELIYNGTTYTATITNTAGNDYNISKTIDIPITTGSKYFHFNFTMAGTEYNTSNQSQTIALLNFSLCDGSITDKYLNLSFKDEESTTYIDATIDASTWYYWLGSSVINKTYTYSTSTNQSNYTFCSSAENDSIKLDMNVQYSTDSFPQRRYENTSTYINSSVMNTILYLLSSGDGKSVTFQVLSIARQPISGVYVEAYRTIGGSSTLVASGTTGDDGGVTFWLNPDYSHTIIFVKTGYDTETLTITPTQTTYTVTLGGEAIETTTEDYSRGVSYSITPTDLTLNLSSNYWFNFTISSTYWDLDGFGFTLTNSTSTLGSDSDTTGTGGTTSLYLNTSYNTTIKMYWYYNIDGNYTNGTKTWWVANFTDYGYGISTFFTDLKAYTASGIFGLNEFSRTLLIFILIFVVVGMFSYMSGVYSPAALIWLILALVALFDVGAGMLPSLGITYFPTILTFLVAIGLTLREGMK